MWYPTDRWEEELTLFETFCSSEISRTYFLECKTHYKKEKKNEKRNFQGHRHTFCYS